jgi:Amt family ammonium transporter
MKRLWGIRVEEHVETAGLDVAEHGMWGYPEFYIPVPGGYGTNERVPHLSHLYPAPQAPVAPEPETPVVDEKVA